MMRSSAVGSRSIITGQPERFHLSKIIASTGCTGTERGCSVLVDFSLRLGLVDGRSCDREQRSRGARIACRDDASADFAIVFFNDVGAPCHFPTASDDGGGASFAIAPSFDCRELCASSDPRSGAGTCTVTCAADGDCPPSSVHGEPLTCAPV